MKHTAPAESEYHDALHRSMNSMRQRQHYRCAFPSKRRMEEMQPGTPTVIHRALSRLAPLEVDHAQLDVPLPLGPEVIQTDFSFGLSRQLNACCP
jgi:hypothetical protein